MMVAASRAATGRGGLAGDSSGGGILAGYRPPAPRRPDGGARVAVGRLAAPRSGAVPAPAATTPTAGAPRRWRQRRQRHPTTGPRGPPPATGPDGPRHLGLRRPRPGDRGRPAGGEGDPGDDHPVPPRWPRPRDRSSRRRPPSPAPSSTRWAPPHPEGPCPWSSRGSRPLAARRAGRRWSTSARSSAPTARRSGGPWWWPSAASGPSATWARRLVPLEVFPGTPDVQLRRGHLPEPLRLASSATEEYGPSLTATGRPASPSSTTPRRWPPPSWALRRPAGPGTARSPSSTSATASWSSGAGIGFSPGSLAGVSMAQIASDLSSRPARWPRPCWGRPTS